MSEMQANWLFEKDMFLEGNPERMFEIVRELGMNAKWTKYVPFEGAEFTQFPAGDCAVVYGSMNLANHVAKVNPWKPGVWTSPHALRTSTYLAHWGRFSVQRDYAMFPLGEVRRMLPLLVERFGVEGKIFLRPNENDKSFSGAVVHQEHFEKWYAMNERCYNLDPTSVALVSRPQRILSEHRFIVADRQVITGSKYRRGEQLLDGVDAAGFDEPAKQFAEQVIRSSNWQPLRIYALDVAELSDGYAFMEIGSVNSCGLYGCDLHAVIEHASRIAVENWSSETSPVTLE
jgi:hypothetical protein